MRSALSVCITLLAFSLAAPLQAQDTGELTVRGGATFATISQDSDLQGFEDTGESRVGFTAGLDYDFPLTGQSGAGPSPAVMLGLRPGLHYVQKGESGEGDDGDIKADYLQIPVLLDLNFTGNEGLQPRLFAGPTFGFLVSCEFEPDTNQQETENEIACEDAPNFEEETFEWGLTVGAGVTIRAIDIEARFDWGLSDIVDLDQSTDLQEVDSVTNRAVVITAGFALGG